MDEQDTQRWGTRLGPKKCCYKSCGPAEANGETPPAPPSPAKTAHVLKRQILHKPRISQITVAPRGADLPPPVPILRIGWRRGKLFRGKAAGPAPVAPRGRPIAPPGWPPLLRAKGPTGLGCRLGALLALPAPFVAPCRAARGLFIACPPGTTFAPKKRLEGCRWVLSVWPTCPPFRRISKRGNRARGAPIASLGPTPPPDGTQLAD